jgi:hypothetical protein
MKGHWTTLKKCRGCGREFTTSKEKLALEKQYCRRAGKYRNWCDDKRCERIRRIVPANKVKVSFKVKHHCTENKIKMTEEGKGRFSVNR